MATNEDYSQIDVSTEEKDKLVAEVMRYILFKTHQTSGCPIKREELTQIITKNYRQRALPALVINEAREKLSSIFGYEMKELQRTRALSSRSTRSSHQSAVEAKSYVIVSQLPFDVYSKYVEDKGTSHMPGFAFVAISIVHLAGGKITEGMCNQSRFKMQNIVVSCCLKFGRCMAENLWHLLRRLGLNENDENHPVFGNNKQALDLLVHQRYLQKDKVAGPEGNIMMYELAERALDQSISGKLSDYISQVVSTGTTAEVD